MDWCVRARLDDSRDRGIGKTVEYCMIFGRSDPLGRLDHGLELDVRRPAGDVVELREPAEVQRRKLPTVRTVEVDELSPRQAERRRVFDTARAPGTLRLESR